MPWASNSTPWLILPQIRSSALKQMKWMSDEIKHEQNILRNPIRRLHHQALMDWATSTHCWPGLTVRKGAVLLVRLNLSHKIIVRESHRSPKIHGKNISKNRRQADNSTQKTFSWAESVPFKQNALRQLIKDEMNDGWNKTWMKYWNLKPEMRQNILLHMVGANNQSQQ